MLFFEVIILGRYSSSQSYSNWWNIFRAKFINQTVAFLEEWQFDGLDLVGGLILMRKIWKYDGDFRIGNFRDLVIVMHHRIVKWNLIFSFVNYAKHSMMKQYELIKRIDYFWLQLWQLIQRKSIKVTLFLNFASKYQLFLSLNFIIDGYPLFVVHWIMSMSWLMITMVWQLMDWLIFEQGLFIVGKWDQVTGINSPLYRSHTELEDHEDWKNAVGKRRRRWWMKGIPWV